MVNAQVWLDSNYPSKTEKKLERTKASLEGELTINNFPNLEKIVLSSNKITKLIIENCPKVQEINVYDNKLTKLEINSLLELEYLNCGNNSLRELDVSENIKLKTLNYLNNPIENQLENLKGKENLVNLEGFRGKGFIKELNELIVREREIHQDAMKAMDDFYRQNPPSEDTRLTNILQQVSEDYLSINLENKQKEQENRDLKKVIEGLKEIVIQTEDEFLFEKVENKRTQLEQLKTDIRNRLDERWHETLEELLEIQVAFTQLNNNLLLNQLKKLRQKLLNSGQITQEKLEKICYFQSELMFLEKKLEQQQSFQAQIETSSNN